MSRKLFVLVRSDLSKSQQAVQAGHAVASFCSAELTRDKCPRWDNETLVYLRGGNLTQLQHLLSKCTEAWPFYEPDLKDQLTAFAVLTPPDGFETLRLM